MASRPARPGRSSRPASSAVPTADAPASPGTWQWLDNPSRSPYTHPVHPAVVTVLAYRVAYRYSRGRKGPWSEPSQAACTPST